MSGEETTIRRSAGPVTRERLARDLSAVGVRPGSVLIAHSSLSALGWVCGGPQAVVEALLDALGAEGTLVVPTHTGANSDPAEWRHPPVPESWWQPIRDHMPPYDPRVTPVRGLGAVVEVARTWPGARRSEHPQDSFAAIGPEAEAITAGHALDSGLGERSPLGRVHDADGDVLLLGVDHGSNTSLHLAEHRVPDPPRKAYGAAVRGPDGRRWVTWEDIVTEQGDFPELGAAFDATGAARIGRAGGGRGAADAPARRRRLRGRLADEEPGGALRASLRRDSPSRT